MTMIAVTYSYARVSKADDDSKNLDTQLLLLAEHGIRPDLVYSDVASGRNLQRPGWQELMARVQEGDTIVVSFLDRLYSTTVADLIGGVCSGIAGLWLGGAVSTMTSRG